MKIASHEIRAISSLGDRIHIPMEDAETSTAVIQMIDLEGIVFQGLCICMPGDEVFDTVIDLQSKIVYELIPPCGYNPEIDEDLSRRTADLDTLKKMFADC